MNNRITIGLVLTWCIILNLILGKHLLHGQSLDSLYSLYSHQTLARVIMIDDDEILVLGDAKDTTTFAADLHVTRLDYSGNVLMTNYIFDGTNYLANNSHTAVIHDSFLFYSPLTQHPTEPHAVLKFNKNTGTLIEKINLPNFKYPGNRIGMGNMCRIDSQRIIMAHSVRNPANNRAETQLTVMDLEDYMMEFIHLNFPNYSQSIVDVISRNGLYYIGGKIQKGDANSPDFDARLIVAALNPNGTIRWRYVSPNGQGAWVFDMYIDDEGNILITHGFRIQYCIGDFCIPIVRPAVSKISPDGQLIWERAVGRAHYNDSGLYNFLRAILPSIDGEGYVAAGAQSNFSFDEYDQWPVDTIATGAYFQDDALIVKLSKDGDSLWMRSYSKVEQFLSADVFASMTYHPNGGYLLTGYAAEYIPGEPLARMWLLHVDEYGCAVPGCHEIVSTSDPEAQTPMLIYPNPGSTELYIYQGDDRAYHYRVSDVSGRTLVSFKGSRAGHTSIVDTAAWPPGYYVVSRIDDAGRILSQGWIKL